MSITRKQKDVLDFITDYLKQHQIAPTQKEIKDHFGLKSFGSVQRYLKYLINAGFLESDWNARRGLKLLKKTKRKDIDEAIPLLGLVAAGGPMEAIENPTETINIPKSMLRPNYIYFALKIKGNSMIEEGILENDIIICKQQQTANAGEIVVAIWNGEATVKKFYPKKERIELHPANNSMKPIIVKNGDFKIAGVLTGLVRSYGQR